MHLSTMLTAAMFDVAVGGRPAAIAEALPGWNEHDRFGVVIDEPLGGVGASHLIQIAAVAFYDARPARRRELPVYPDIYAFHVGRGHGAHAAFDFWPSRREVMVTGGDHRDLLDAINDRGITRLALPERAPTEIVHRPKEREAALDRLASAFLYHPSGRVADGDLVIAARDAKAEYSPGRVLRPVYPEVKAAPPPPAPGGRSVKERDPSYGDWLQARKADVTEAQRDEAERRREAIRQDGLATESYRRIPPAEAVDRLGLSPA